jgi:hypothetical protein
MLSALSDAISLQADSIRDSPPVSCVFCADAGADDVLFFAPAMLCFLCLDIRGVVVGNWIA